MSKETQQDAADEADEHECALVYHVRRKRRLRGFLPLYVLLSALLLGVLLWLVPIRMPEDELPGRIGRVYYRDDRLLQFHLMQRSPLPFALPDGVDPAAEPVGRLDVPLSRPTVLMELEPLPLYSASGDSCVLDGVDLLALPPVESSPGSDAAPSPDGGVSPSQGGADDGAPASVGSDVPDSDVSDPAAPDSDVPDAATPVGASEALNGPEDSVSTEDVNAAVEAAEDAPASPFESGARSGADAPHHPNPAAEAAGDTEPSARPGEEVQP